jgi:hypothetical protein
MAISVTVWVILLWAILTTIAEAVVDQYKFSNTQKKEVFELYLAVNFFVVSIAAVLTAIGVLQ